MAKTSPKKHSTWARRENRVEVRVEQVTDTMVFFRPLENRKGWKHEPQQSMNKDRFLEQYQAVKS